MKQIAVIAQKRELADYIKSCLEVFFFNTAVFRVYSTDDIEKIESIEEEIVVISAYVIFKQVQNKIRSDAILQTFSQVLSKNNVDRLKAAGVKGRALLVSVDYFVCMQTIAQLYEAGFQDIDFIPFYGNTEALDGTIDVAVTANEEALVPCGIRRVINLGERTVDVDCIIELAEKIGEKNPFSTPEACRLRDCTAQGPSGINKIFNEAENANQTVVALIEYMDDGVVVVDFQGRIFSLNQKAKDYLGVEESAEGFSIREILPEIDLSRNHENGNEHLFELDGKRLIVANRRIYSDGKPRGNIITLRNYDEQEQHQYTMRNRLYGKSHVAKNTFDDIRGSSQVIRKCIETAKRMAASNASVLITGPSGSGKEIFAQSIHNASSRKNYNFIALNCAAIPENLLESELFGYEAGAFTGANKSGKVGYFELAHRGTIFLDEIGEMSLSLQSKLLRVIEERSFVRIGSSKLINVDVRIIAATNQNLGEMVRAKRFREDLFFRINVLPLNLPPISEREEDAMELLYYFRDINGWKWELEGRARRFLERYAWPGNIREIRNAAEYMDNVGENVITVDRLPYYMKEKDSQESSTVSREMGFLKKSDNLSFIIREGRNLEIYGCVLEILYNNGKEQHLGRKQIAEELLAEGESYSEAEIRDCLKRLSDAGYIKSKRGPGGSYILQSGKALLQDIKEILGR